MGKSVQQGVNDLRTWCELNSRADVLMDWDSNTNSGFTPETVSYASNKRVWWKCNKGHCYQKPIHKRTLSNQGCPYCSGKRVLKGFNDLESQSPDLMLDWDYIKNTDFGPDEVSKGCNKYAWWKCHICGHEWKTKINDRNRTGCPECSKQKQGIAYTQKMIAKNNNSLESSDDLLAEWDYEKNTIKPSEISLSSSRRAWWRCSVCGNSWEAIVSNRARGSGCPKCMKHQRTSFPEQAIVYYASKVFSKVYNGYTEIFENKMELDVFIADINVAIEYDGIAFHSGKKAEKDMQKKYELCREKGIHLIRVSEFENKTLSYDQCFVRRDFSDEALSDVISRLLISISDACVSVDVVRDRTEIMKQYVISLREKSISFRFPEMAKEWDIKKNNGLRPNQVNANSNKKYWWVCPLGHSYQAAPVNRSKENSGCHYCSNLRVLPGFNDLATRYPDIAKEWDYDLNYPKKPSEVMPGSQIKYWWKCSKGHSYQSRPNDRTSQNSGCPYCAGRVIRGIVCVETGIVYKDYADASKYTGIHPEGISRCCKGKQKTAGGYHWKCN